MKRTIVSAIGVAVLIPAILPGISPSSLLTEPGGPRSCDFRPTSAQELRFHMVCSRQGGIK
jgi:hypothetical protein